MLPREILLKYFGHKKFRPNQKEIIASIMAGKNVLAVLPTGAGKSICYQVPAIASDNFSIVISPLIALMKDQVDSLNKIEPIAAFINSSMSFYEAEEVLQNISYGKYKILYAAPERLENIAFADRIKELNPSYLFVDEAHCISEWGHNFRPSYSKIKEFIEYVKIPKISAFTATATPEVVKDIVTQLNLKDPRLFVKGFERENLHLNVEVIKNKNARCLELIRQIKPPAIIYTASRKKAEEVSEYLVMNRVNCSYYHAGLQPLERKRIQEAFLNDEVPVIAATNAFGMGIDKKDIRLVIHYNTPGSVESYYQEIGRAGRDGKNSFAYLLHDDSDINIQNFFLSNSHPDKELIKNVYNAICDFSKIAVGSLPEREIPVNIDYISNYSHKTISRGLLHASLKYLEQGGYLRPLSEFDKKASVKITTAKNKLKDFIKSTSNERIKEVMLVLLREYSSEIFAGNLRLSLTKMAGLADLSEDDVHETLVTLDNLGLIEYRNILSRENILLTVPRVSAEQLKLDYKKINESYLRMQKKIDTMVEYVYSGKCRFNFILNYFGEDVSNYSCGKCDRCVDEEKIPAATSEYVKEIILRTLSEMNGEANASSLLRIIHGSVRSTANSNYTTFGTCANYTMEELKLILQELISENRVIRNSGNSRILQLPEDKTSDYEEPGLFEDETTRQVEEADYELNLELFNLLKQVRTQASKRFLQTGYLICPDDVLKDIALKKPLTKTEMLNIGGFNNRMFNKLGHEFLDVINDLMKEKENKQPLPTKERTLPKNIAETYNLLSKGYCLADIASLRKLSEAVISMQIETILEYKPETSVEKLFEGSMLTLILGEISKGYKDLKDLKNRLPGEISYPLIRIAVAKSKFTSSFSF